MTEAKEPSFKSYDLSERGTRYEHYQELKELFSLGIEVLQNSSKTHPSDSDSLKLAKLRAAVELIDGRLDLLTGYKQLTVYGSKLRVEVDSIPSMKYQMALEDTHAKEIRGANTQDNKGGEAQIS